MNITRMTLPKMSVCPVSFLILAASVVEPAAPAGAEVVQVRIRKNLMMPARDGVRLATDVYLPDGELEPKGPFPTILIRTPYSKAGMTETAEFFVKHGFAVVTQDVRGRYSSEGEFYIYVNEGPDGFDAVEWVASRPWCRSDVGTYGGSYLAATQNAAAVLRPPHFGTMFVVVGTSNYVEDGAGRGGAFALLHNMTYGFRLAYTGKEGHTYDAEEPEDTPGGLAMQQAYAQLGDWLESSPLKSGGPLDLTPSYRQWYEDWRAHPIYDDYWKQNGYNFEEYHSQYPDIPICFVGGWYDIFKRGTLKNFEGLHGRNKSHTKLIMGPWTHSTGKTFAGDVDFGKAAEMKIKQQALGWFNRVLKGEEEDIVDEPDVSYFVMSGEEPKSRSDGRMQSGGEWKTAATWPPPGYSSRQFFLHGDGSLQSEACRKSAASSFEFDPDQPVPTIGGNIDSGKHLVRRGAQDQTPQANDYPKTNTLPLTSRHDVLSFETAPLEKSVEIAGPIQAEIWVSSSARDTDFTAKLVDVYPPSKDYPAGYAMNLEDGILRMRFRESHEKETLMDPGDVYKVTIDLWATANRFNKGHKIRLDISSSNFPMYDVNPNTGGPLGKPTRRIKAINTIYHSQQRPSHVKLPVLSN